MPLDALEVFDVLDDQLVACDDNVKRRFLHVHVLLAPELAKDPAILRVAPVWNHLHVHTDGTAQHRYTLGSFQPQMRMISTFTGV